MSSRGFIKIDRQITDWRWWGNPNAMALWLYILVNANWTDGYWHQGETLIRAGELVTSQVKMAEELNMNRRTLKKYLEMFRDAGQITLTVTNRFTRINVINYAKFQSRG